MIRTLLCIAAIWGTTGVAFVFGVGRVAVAIVSVLYLASVAVMFLRYRSSQFGRTWIPRLFGQYFEWSPLVQLRSLAPPLGSLGASDQLVVVAELVRMAAPDLEGEHCARAQAEHCRPPH